MGRRRGKKRISQYYRPSSYARGGNTEILISILANLAICTIPHFNQISREFDEVELNLRAREQVGNITQGENSRDIPDGFLTLRNIFGSRLMREGIGRRNQTCIPTRAVADDPPRMSYPHFLSAVMLSNCSQGVMLSNCPQGGTVRERAVAHTSNAHVLEDSQARPVRPSEGSSSGPRHFHAPKRRRVAPGELAALDADTAFAGLNETDRLAFRTESLFRGTSSTFRFCDSSAYEVHDVADFIVRALRSRARKDATSAMASKLVAELYIFAVKRVPPMPVRGDESLIAVTKWLELLAKRGKTAPGLGRYELKVYGGALGAVFPTDHPAVRNAVAILGAKPKSDPALETDFVFALEAGAGDKNAPIGLLLYYALFTMLPFASL